MSAPDDTFTEPELRELALILREDAPEPDRAFAEDLGARVREGFPRERRSRLRLPAMRPRAMLAAGALASLAIAIPVAVSLQDDDPDVQDAAAPGEGAREAPPAPSAAPLSSIPSPPRDDFEARGRRAIERSAQLTLAAPGAELDNVADSIVAVTDRYRGFVLRSSVTSGDDSTTGGSFELRIPADRLRPAIRELSELGHVRSRTQAGEDVTRSVTSVRERLASARAERRSLLRRLENAGSGREAEGLRRRLDLVTGEIRTLRGQARVLRTRVRYAAVSVSLVEDDGNEGAGAPGGGTKDALDDALGSLTGALNLIIRALGVLIPLGLLGGATWLAARFALRRRREAALS